MKNMLLLSSSKYKNTGYLEHTIPWLQNFLTDYRGKTIAFVPYAGVRRTFDEYEKTVQNALSNLGMNIVSVHHGKQHRDIIEQADVIAIGGGNTFCLLKQLYEHNLIDIIRKKVNNGTPYFGWSAGANVAGASIMTTNDMPITYPPSFQALQLFPHQINPHLYMHCLKVLRFIYKMKWQLCWVKILFCASVKIWNVAHLTSIQLFLINLKGTYNGII